MTGYRPHRVAAADAADAVGPTRQLEEAGLTAAQIDKLQVLPWKEYYAFATNALERLREQQGGARGLRRGFNPVVNGDILPQDPYYPEAAPTAADVPMIICSTFHEISPGFRAPDSDDVTLDEVAENVRGRAGFRAGYGDKAKEVVEAHARAFPDKKPVEIWALVSSTRQRTVALADAKSKQPAPGPRVGGARPRLTTAARVCVFEPVAERSGGRVSITKGVPWIAPSPRLSLLSR